MLTSIAKATVLLTLLFTIILLTPSAPNSVNQNITDNDLVTTGITTEEPWIAEGPSKTFAVTRTSPPPNLKEWTLLFHMAGDGNNEGICIDDVNAMERGVNTSLTNVVVQVDRVAGGDSSNGDWTTCRRYLIEPDANIDRTIRSTMLADLGEVNYGDPQIIADFFIWGAQNYPAKKYVMAVWGGAMPNGVGADATPGGDATRTLYGEMTDIYELTTDALGRRIDMAVVWGCNYGMFENDYMIREYADVTTRSEIPTWNAEGAATDILEWLNGNITADARQLGKAWVDLYNDYAASKGRCGGWASIDMGPGFDRTGLALDTFARELIKAGGRNQTDIATALASTVHCYSIDMDMCNFAQKIVDIISLPQSLRTAAATVIDEYGYPVQDGKPLINFRFTEGYRATNEVWPEPYANSSQLTGTKIRQLNYTVMPINDPADVAGRRRYDHFVDNNAWHWFLDGETSLPPVPKLTFNSSSLDYVLATDGSQVAFNLTLRNSGGAAAGGIEAALRTDEENVTIDQGTASFPDIASEGTGLTLSDFRITANGGLPEGHRIWFWVDITADGGYASNTSFPVEFSRLPDIPPSADAGEDQEVDQGTTVAFEGSGSGDNIGIVNFTWNMTYDGAPESVYGISPEFTFDIPGVYPVTLTVRDGLDNPAVDVINVTVVDTEPPIADAGEDHIVDQGETVPFSAEGSSDNVGVVNFTWTFTDGGAKTVHGIMPGYEFTNAGVYEVNLTVADGRGNLAYDEVTVTVIDIMSPVADAGPDIRVDQHESFRFDGTASSDNVGIANFTWEVEFGDVATLYGPTPLCVIDDAGDLFVRLIVEDEEGNSDVDTLELYVTDITPPVADAGPDQVVDEDTKVHFDGSASSDNVGILAWSWSIEPSGIHLTASPTPSFTFIDPGHYSIRLGVEDRSGNHDTDFVNITVLDITPPTPDAGDNITVDQGKTVILDASRSRDNDKIVNFTWSFDHNGTNVTLDGVRALYIFETPGEYEVTLTVTDAEGNEAQDTVLVMVMEDEQTGDGTAGPGDGLDDVNGTAGDGTGPGDGEDGDPASEEKEEGEGSSLALVAWVIAAVAAIVIIAIVLVLMRRKKRGGSAMEGEGEKVEEGGEGESVPKGPAPISSRDEEPAAPKAGPVTLKVRDAVAPAEGEVQGKT